MPRYKSMSQLNGSHAQFASSRRGSFYVPDNYAYMMNVFQPQTTMLPQAFQTMTPQDLSWNMDTGASSHLADNTGYPANHRGYRCLELSSNKIIMSRHVRFDEDVLPFGTVMSSTKPSYDFLLPPKLHNIQPNIIPTPEPIVQNFQPPPNPSTTATQPISAPPSLTVTSPLHTHSSPSLTLVAPSVHTQSQAQTITPPQLDTSHTTSHTNNSTQIVSMHPMVTRAKADIFKPLESMNCYVTTTSSFLRSHVHALRNPNWKKAMLDEYNALITNGTWVLVPRPANVNVVRSMWFFKHKFHANGSLSRYKARLITNGCSQQQGIDCDDTFSPVVKPATIRTVLSLAVLRAWPIHQLDVKNAFLYGYISETVYMHQPSGFADLAHPDYVCHFQRSLYGLKQASRAWFQRFASYATRVCLYMHDPRKPHLAALKRILRYVHGTLDHGLRLHVSTTTQLTAYTDANRAGCPITRWSTSGYCVFLRDDLLSWSAKRQVTLLRSSAEAEYRGVANVVAETV
ncbi:ribonuclease H-like domain-containing protein [Tanacetum coccineum]|uniref:Ribonuclease H-like domain-containing protein n=1 Tax=Tanacetum coccineum TaxID=301880 RepID=A0ABQ5ATP9_9ASTR